MTSTATLSIPTTRTRPGLDFTALWTLYLLTIRQHMRGKRWIVMAILFLIPAGLAIFVRATAPDAPTVFIEFVFAFMFIPQALLPLVALVYASGIIQDELEEQTITYLLIRPIPRWALYIVKMLATLTTCVVLTFLFTILTYAAVYAGAHNAAADLGAHPITRCLQAASIHSLAVIAYCCLFGMLSLLTKRSLVMGIIYTAIFEGLLANLPLSIRLVTIIYYTRVIAYRTMQFVGIQAGQQVDIAADAWQLDIVNDPHLLEHPQFNTCLTTLLAASVAFVLIAAFLCSRREFYVKTPEKS